MGVSGWYLRIRPPGSAHTMDGMGVPNYASPVLTARGWQCLFNVPHPSKIFLSFIALVRWFLLRMLDTAGCVARWLGQSGL